MTRAFVKRVDPKTKSSLANKLSAPAWLRRLQMIQAMYFIREPADVIVKLLDDSDHMVPTAVVRALCFASSRRSVQTPSHALADRWALGKILFEKLSVTVTDRTKKRLLAVLAHRNRHPSRRQ